jgi:hypothetical protein
MFWNIRSQRARRLKIKRISFALFANYGSIRLLSDESQVVQANCNLLIRVYSRSFPADMHSLICVYPCSIVV